jgi:hypothetical protein
MKPQLYQEFSDETHEATGNCFELDLSVGTILTVNRPVGIKHASYERARDHLLVWSKGLQFLQAKRHSPRMKDRCDFLGMSI